MTKHLRLVIFLLVVSELVHKKSYFCEQVHSNRNDSGKNWNLLNKFIGRDNKKPAPELIVHNDVILNSPEGICNAFSRHLLSLESPRLERYDATHISRSAYLFYLHPTDDFEVSSVILRTTASGVDNISARAIKLVKDNISPILAHIINTNFLTGIFPHQMEIAKVLPIFK